MEKDIPVELIRMFAAWLVAKNGMTLPADSFKARAKVVEDYILGKA